MLNKEQLLALAKVTAQADPASPIAYSFGEDKFKYTELNDLLRDELNALAGSYPLYRENKNTIFELIEVVVDTVLPQRVVEQYAQFADIQTFNQGDKPVFKERFSAASRRRAKRFVTKVGLAGVYEVFRLDGAALEIPTTAYGGAAQISIEEFLDGRIQMSDVLEIVMEGLDDAIYFEIAKALGSTVSQMAPTNVASTAGFDETTMDRLIAIADSYGKSAIYCTYEFAAKIAPVDNWVSDEMRNQMWNNGYLANYKGHQVIVLNQAFLDDANTIKAIDPSVAWIIPVGAEKPVKIAFEGQTLVDERSNQDWSKEIQVYKKLGVGVMATNGICRYEDTELSVDMK